VTFYSLNIDIDTRNKKIEGYVDIHFTILAPSKRLQIDLTKNLSLETITFKEKTLKAQRVEDAIFVQLPYEMQANEKGTLRVEYQGIPKSALMPPWSGGFVWEQDEDGYPWLGVACEGDGAHIWWPLKDHPSDEPDSMAINIRIPNNKKQVCLANGQLRGIETNKDTRTFKWFVSYPINPYNVTFYIGNYKHFKYTYKGESNLDSLSFWVLPYNYKKAQRHFKQTLDIFRFFEQTFGPYPWPKDGYKLVESPYEGMEHQSAIAYGNGYENDVIYGFDYIILHETAHEWWGNSITADDMAELWIHEGFATYAEALYVEHISGYEKYIDYLKGQRRQIQNKYPLIGPKGIRYEIYGNGMWDSDIYFKGSNVLHTLRTSIHNDSLFRRIIKRFGTEYRAKIINSEAFIQLVNEETGEDYRPFFNHYLHEPQLPQFVYSIREEKNAQDKVYVLYYQWMDVAPDFWANVSIQVKDKEKPINLHVTTEQKRLILGESNQMKPVFGHGYYTFTKRQ